jgi:hypothetical protein
LRDAKIKFAIETFGSAELFLFADCCGWTLARAHARSGEPALIAGYLGESDVFDRAIADFSVAYADQTEKDHEALTKAIAGSQGNRLGMTFVAVVTLFLRGAQPHASKCPPRLVWRRAPPPTAGA